MRVELSHVAQKQLARVPDHILRKFAIWAHLVNLEGLAAARSVAGFRDHALRGYWKGYRAIRLNDSYRAIYRLMPGGTVETVRVEQVTKHVN